LNVSDFDDDGGDAGDDDDDNDYGSDPLGNDDDDIGDDSYGLFISFISSVILIISSSMTSFLIFSISSLIS